MILCLTLVNLPGSLRIKVEHVKIAVADPLKEKFVSLFLPCTLRVRGKQKYTEISLQRHGASNHRSKDSEEDHCKGVIGAHPRLVEKQFTVICLCSV